MRRTPPLHKWRFACKCERLPDKWVTCSTCEGRGYYTEEQEYELLDTRSHRLFWAYGRGDTANILDVDPEWEKRSS